MTNRLTAAEIAELRQVVGDAVERWAADRQPPAVPAPAPALPRKNPYGLTPQYAWLAVLGDTMPLTIAEALKELGVKEVAGAANSPVIMGWAKEVGIAATYTNDAIPWCGLFAAVICTRARKPIPEGPLWALNWAKFGVESKEPGLGDVLVYKRDGGGGHVNFYVGEDATHYHGIGGNQSDGVNIMRLEKRRLVAARRPIYANQPAAVRPYHLAATGLVSTNEA